MEVLSNLTDEQYEYYTSNMPINENPNTIKGMIVDYSMEDEIKRGTGVNFKEYLHNWEKEINQKYN